MGVENNIPEGWLYTELGKVSENIFSGGTPNTRINKYWNGSLNWLSSGETGSNFIYSTIKSITQLGVDNSSTRLALKDDVVVATAGQGNTRGQVSFMSIDSYINQSIIAIRGNKNTLFNKWLFYNLSYRYKELRFISESNSVRGSITTKMLSSLIKLKLPPLPEQKAIAKILTAFDDKIELLQAQNKTLETILKVKHEDLFTVCSSVDCPKVKVGDYVKTNSISINKNYDHNSILYMDTGSLTNGVTESLQEIKLSEAPSRAKRLVKHNDILISTVRPNQKHFGIIKYPINNLVVSTGFCVISCEKIDPHFLYYVLTSNDMTDYLHSIAEGSTSTYPSIKPIDLESVEFVLPPNDRIEKFSKTASIFWDKIHLNQIQVKSLTKTRDTLLPKLMSGQVRVKNIKHTADA